MPDRKLLRTRYYERQPSDYSILIIAWPNFTGLPALIALPLQLQAIVVSLVMIIQSRQLILCLAIEIRFFIIDPKNTTQVVR